MSILWSNKMNIRFTLDGGDHCTNHTNHARDEYKIVPGMSALAAPRVHDNDVHRVSGLKILTAMALYAWRRRRNDINQLMESVKDLKESSSRTKNQLEVYNTLIRIEQKRNDELTSQLERTFDQLNKSRSSGEALSTALVSMRNDKIQLEDELKTKYEEYDAIHDILSQTKTDLFRSMMEERKLQTQLCQETQTVQTLKNQKNQLIDQIYNLNTEIRKTQMKFKRQLEEKEQRVIEMKTKLNDLETIPAELIEKERNRQDNTSEMTEEIKRLRRQVILLQEQLDDKSKLSNRLRIYWNQFVDYQRSTLRYAHIFAYYLLPATPPPPAFTRRC